MYMYIYIYGELDLGMYLPRPFLYAYYYYRINVYIYINICTLDIHMRTYNSGTLAEVCVDWLLAIACSKCLSLTINAINGGLFSRF